MNEDFKVERLGDNDFKLTCKVCEKPMVEAKQFVDYMKTAMVAVMRENGGDMDDPDIQDKTRVKMEQLKICLHGGYEGIGYSLDISNGKTEKIFETDKPDYIIKEEMLPPTKNDERWDMIAKRLTPIFLKLKGDGKTNEEILDTVKFICFNMLGYKPEGFTMEDFDKTLRPMIEAAGKE